MKKRSFHDYLLLLRILKKEVKGYDTSFVWWNPITYLYLVGMTVYLCIKVVIFGKDCKLFAKLKIDKEPLDKLEAITVMTTKFICDIARLSVRGIIIFPILQVFTSRQNILNLYLKPK